MTAPLLEMQGIVKQFPGVRALDGVDLDVRPGEVHCLLGQNGAGKSTLIKVLAGADVEVHAVQRPHARELLHDALHLEQRSRHRPSRLLLNVDH